MADFNRNISERRIYHYCSIFEKRNRVLKLLTAFATEIRHGVEQISIKIFLVALVTFKVV